MYILNNLYPVCKNCFQATGHFISHACNAINQRMHNLSLSIFKNIANFRTEYSDIERCFSDAEKLVKNCEKIIEDCEKLENVETIHKLPGEISDSINREMIQLKTELDHLRRSPIERKIQGLEYDQALKISKNFTSHILKFKNTLEKFCYVIGSLSAELRKHASPSLNEDQQKALESKEGQDLIKTLLFYKQKLLQNRVHSLLTQGTNSLDEIKRFFSRSNTTISTDIRVYISLICEGKMKVIENQLCTIVWNLKVFDVEWTRNNNNPDISQRVILDEKITKYANDVEEKITRLIQHLEEDKSKLAAWCATKKDLVWENLSDKETDSLNDELARLLPHLV